MIKLATTEITTSLYIISYLPSFLAGKSRSMNSNTDKKIPKIVSTTANFGHWVEEHCLFAWLQVRRIHLGDAIKV
jgi:hypothetical protein